MATPELSGTGADLGALRKEYSTRGIDREDLDDDPIRQFDRWFEEARSAGLHEPNAMSLATANASGELGIRTVLLKLYDARGFVFFTNYGSRKARDIAENAHVALLFPWIPLERQVKITGRAEKIATAESLRYFQSRPRGSQIGAWVSNQSQPLTSRQMLEGTFRKMQEKFREGKVPLPDFWGGYRVVPETIEFWQGRQNRLHDRFEYRRSGEGWDVRRLMP